MAVALRGSIAIIHEHGLLGEGIAQYLLTTLGLHAVVIPAADDAAVDQALRAHPSVVIFEASPDRDLDLAARCPDAELIDVSSVFSTQVRSTPASLLEKILAPAARPA